MNLILFALRKPVTILVMVAALFFFGIGALRTIARFTLNSSYSFGGESLLHLAAKK